MTAKLTRSKRRILPELGSVRYFEVVADARFVIRRVLRLVDEQAKSHGLESVEHQALIQIVGAQAEHISVGDLADRLFISATFASRLVKVLLSKGFVRTQLSDRDQRVVHITATQGGLDMLALIENDLRLHIEYFTKQLPPDVKRSALTTFALYVGTRIEIVDHGTSMDTSLLAPLGSAIK